MSWRLLRVVLDQLPSTSSYWRARHGSGDWTVHEYLLADLFDALALANWQRTGDAKAAHPKPYPRPHEATTREGVIERRAREFRDRQARAEAGSQTAELVSRKIRTSR